MKSDDPAELRRALLDWYGARARELPWRETSDPYRIWVSEVMLQQTRVETVVPYYLRWMELFPDLRSLAEAPEEEVLGAWAGLGYYSRARNLHRAVRVVRERHDGVVPADPADLRALPGVGEYTAGAMASIAFGIPVPAVDGNVRRVMARLTDTPDPAPAEVRRWAADQVDPDRPGDFNQALMELGATVCAPRNPRCPTCPVESLCASARAGTQGDRPLGRRRSPVREVRFAVAMVVAGHPETPRVLVRRRPSHGLLGGMWEFPAEELSGAADAEGVAAAARRAVAPLLPGPGLEGVPFRTLSAVPHRFSHLSAVYHPVAWLLGPGYRSAVESAGTPGADSVPPLPEAPSGARWIEPRAPGDLPLSAAQRRMLEELAAGL